MPVPRFDSIEDAAAFVVQHHRLPDILSVSDLPEFVRFLFNEADGAATLPSLTLEFFRGKVAQVDREIRGE
jgi:hypothetical protein